MRGGVFGGLGFSIQEALRASLLVEEHYACPPQIGPVRPGTHPALFPYLPVGAICGEEQPSDGQLWSHRALPMLITLPRTSLR